MITILKGNSSTVSLTLATGYDYTGKTVHFDFCGIHRSFANVTAGQTLSVSFTADETKVLPLGAFPVNVSMVNNGLVTIVTNSGVKICVTDDVSAVTTSGVIAIDAKGGLFGVENLPANYTIKDVWNKVNQIIAKLGGGVAALFLAFSAFGASVNVSTAKLEDLNAHNAYVVTNANIDITGLATETYVQGAIASSGGTTPSVVTNIAGAVVSNVVPSWARQATQPQTMTDAQVLQIIKNSGVIITNTGNQMINGLGVSYADQADYATSAGNSVNAVTSDYATVAAQVGTLTESTIYSGLLRVNEIDGISTAANNALSYSSAIYQYMIGNTNAWFEGTNYVTTADITNRTHFVWEAGMNAGSVPCSFQLREIRNGTRQVVWDQRDWTVWYWNFKANQLSNSLATATANLSNNVNTAFMKRGWAKYTAVQGLDNPASDTLWVDTPKVQLMAGHQWEKLIEVGGAGYWTLTANGINLESVDTTNTFLTIKDFEGNACLTFRKTSSYLVYCECGTDITSNYMDNNGRVVFHLATSVQPTAEFSTTLDLDSFVEETDAGCPADCTWTGTAGNYDCHFKLKAGIVSNACFARFKVMHEGENVVEHTVPIKINGGIAFEQGGVTRKIMPQISGTTVNWVIVQ